MANEKIPQSQSISGSHISGAQIQMGQSRYGNITQNQGDNRSGVEFAGKQLTVTEIVDLLNRLAKELQGSDLSLSHKEKAQKYLEVVKEDVQAEEPDKEQAAKNLKKVTDALKVANETTAEGKKLWETVQPILGQFVLWFGVARGFFGLP